MKTFVLDLRRMKVKQWYCGTKACTMGQFAEQFGSLPSNFDKCTDADKAKIADTACVNILGDKDTEKIIAINDSGRKWDTKLKEIRAILNPKGYAVRVLRNKK